MLFGKPTLEKVLIPVISTAALVVLAAIWSVITDGGLIRALGGATKKELNAMSAIPKGAVVAFDASEGCPQVGWVRFERATSRFIVGASDASVSEVNNTDDNNARLQPIPYAKSGGLAASKLSENEIPLHQHDTLLGIAVNRSWGNGPQKFAVAGASMGHFETALSSPYGKNTPSEFSNLPPYIALFYCKKS